jgi:hypothetical protein
MRTSLIFLVGISLLAAGCSRPDFYWYHPDKSLDEANADYCECRDKADRQAAEAVAEEYFDHLRSPAHPGYSYGSPLDDGGSANDAIDAQMTWGELHKQNAFNGCMRGRGYLWLRAHRVPSSLRTKDLPLGAVAGR